MDSKRQKNHPRQTVTAAAVSFYFIFSFHLTFAASDLLSNITDWQQTVPPVTSSYVMNSVELYVKSTVDDIIVYGWQSAECDKCDLFWYEIESQGNDSQRIQAMYSNVLEVRLRDPNRTIYTSGKRRLVDHGVYWLVVSLNSTQLVLTNSPSNPDLAVLYAFIVLFGLAAIWILITFISRRGYLTRCTQKLNRTDDESDVHVTSYHNNALETSDAELTPPVQLNNEALTHDVTNDVTEKKEITPESRVTSFANQNTASNATTNSAVKRRLQSLDSFRGLSLTIMIFVNYGGGGYWYFEHAVWNGLTVADLVFPWFVFIMGTSIAFSFRSLISNQTPTLSIIWKIVFRAIKLFGLGLFLGTKYNNDMLKIRIPGVLQRFSLTYLVVALVHFPFAKRNNKYATRHKLQFISDLVPYWLEWIIMLTILSIFLALTYALQVPGCPTGYVGPGGLHDSGQHFNCTGGAAGYIDRLVLTENHIYLHPTAKETYETIQGFDPEGILGTLTSIFLCYLGLQAGKIIQQYKGQHVAILIRWTVWGIATGAIALILCNASVNDGWVPLNKNLWSVSYVLAMASTAYLLLAVMYIIIDVFPVWNGSPFKYPGMNSIVIYFCQSSFSGNFPVSWQMPDMQSHWQKLFLAIWGSAFWTFTAYILYCNKIFVAL